MKMKKIIITATLLIGLFFGSCESKTYEEVATVTAPTYTKNIKPLFESKCNTCHSPTAPTNREPYLTTLEEVNNALLDYPLVCLIDDPTQCDYSASDIMPQQGRMPQVTIDMVKLWITNGKPN
jgi:hypothetical protein